MIEILKGEDPKPTTKQQVGRIKKALESFGRVNDLDTNFSSAQAIFDLSMRDGDTFRIQVYKM